MLCIVYWKLNILRYLFPLLFPSPKLLVVLFRNDDQTWEVKGKKRTSEYRRKINGLKASKNWKFFILKFFSRAIEISRPFCASSNSFSTEKNSTVAPVPTKCLKRSKSPMNVLNSHLLVGLRYKDMRFLNKCSTLLAFYFLLVRN